MITCSGSQCQHASRFSCACDCGGAKHGIRGRLAWANALLEITTPPHNGLIETINKRQNNAIENVKKRIARYNKYSYNETRFNIDSNSAVEYARTVDAISWLVNHPTELKQIEALAEDIANECTEFINQTQLLMGATGWHRRAADHLWCDIVASLCKTLRKTRKEIDEILNDTSGAFAKISARTYKYICNSRNSDTGRRPNAHSDNYSCSPPRSARDKADSLTSKIVEATTKSLIKRILSTLAAPGTTSLDDVLLKLRLTVLLMCPDPSAHKLVWDECFLMLINNQLQSDLQDELSDTVDWLQKNIAGSEEVRTDL